MGSMWALYKLVKTKNKISYLVSLTILKNVFAKSREEEIGNIFDGRTKKITMAFTNDTVAKFIATF